ncbi:hypothetical protein KUTeg_024471, partial [Tegillarca granosa]
TVKSRPDAILSKFYTEVRTERGDRYKKSSLFADIINNKDFSDSKKVFLAAVFVDLMLYFGRGGRENIHDFKITDFAATRDSKGKVYIYMKTDKVTKTR